MSPEIETEEPEYRADVGKGGWMVVCLALVPKWLSQRSADNINSRHHCGSRATVSIYD
jgi:hypothetical protein